MVSWYSWTKYLGGIRWQNFKPILVLQVNLSFDGITLPCFIFAKQKWVDVLPPTSPVFQESQSLLPHTNPLRLASTLLLKKYQSKWGNHLQCKKTYLTSYWNQPAFPPHNSHETFKSFRTKPFSSRWYATPRPPAKTTSTTRCGIWSRVQWRWVSLDKDPQGGFQDRHFCRFWSTEKVGIIITEMEVRHLYGETYR